MRFRVSDSVSRVALAFMGSLLFGTMGLILYERNQGRNVKLRVDEQTAPWLKFMVRTVRSLPLCGAAIYVDVLLMLQKDTRKDFENIKIQHENKRGGPEAPEKPKN